MERRENKQTGGCQDGSTTYMLRKVGGIFQPALRYTITKVRSLDQDPIRKVGKTLFPMFPAGRFLHLSRFVTTIKNGELQQRQTTHYSCKVRSSFGAKKGPTHPIHFENWYLFPWDMTENLSKISFCRKRRFDDPLILIPIGKASSKSDSVSTLHCRIDVPNWNEWNKKEGGKEEDAPKTV